MTSAELIFAVKAVRIVVNLKFVSSVLNEYLPAPWRFARIRGTK